MEVSRQQVIAELSAPGGLCEEEEEEIPLEIVDYSCATPFEEEVDAVERFLREVVKLRKEKKNTTTTTDTPELTSTRVEEEFPSREIYHKAICAAGENGIGLEGENQPRSRKLLVEVYYNCKPTDHAIAQTFAPLTDFAVITHDYDLYTASDSTALLSILCCGMDKTYSTRGSSDSSSGGTKFSSTTGGGRHTAALPCFVPTGDVHRRTYIGRHHSDTGGGGFCTRFSMQAEHSIPPQCQSVSGLLDLFHLNVGLQSKVPPGHAVLVDSESDYVSPSLSPVNWNNHLQSENELLSGRVPPSPKFGTLEDPIKHYAITVSWRGVEEKDAVDTTVSTTFNPYGGSVVPSSVKIKLQLRSSLDYSKAAGNTTDDVLRMLFLGVATEEGDDEHHNAGYSRSFTEMGLEEDRRSSGGGRDGSSAHDAHSPAILSALGASILTDDLSTIIDVRGEGVGRGESPPNKTKRHSDDVEAIYPVGSLFSRFAHMCTLTAGVGGGKMRAIETLWSEHVVKGLTKAIDECHDSDDSWTRILGIQPRLKGEEEENFPLVVDHNACLVHQKLQLLKICANTLKCGESAPRSSTSLLPAGSSGGWGSGGGSDEDLFAEEEEEHDGDDEDETKGEDVSSSTIVKVVETLEAKANNEGEEGDEKEISRPTTIPMLRMPNLMLVAPPPLAQAPKCSDQLDEQEASMTALGTSNAAKTTRLWMQRGALLSDMAAFKALNGPRCMFADFVHWHSPHDFEATENEHEKGDFAIGLNFLSERMQVPGNLWLSLWTTTKPQLNVPHFNAAEEIQITLAWLRDLPRKNRLLFRQWIAAYTYSNSMHRMRQHRLFAMPCSCSSLAPPPPGCIGDGDIAPLSSLAQRAGRSIGNGLRGLELDWQHLSSGAVDAADHSIGTFSEQQEVWELYRSKRRQLESVEVLLSVGLSLQQSLMAKDGSTTSLGSDGTSSSRPKKELRSISPKGTAGSGSAAPSSPSAGGLLLPTRSKEEELEAIIQLLLAQVADESQEEVPSVEGPANFTLDHLWLNHLAITLLPPTSYFPPYQAPKPLRRRHTIHAMVERPMNCPAHEQLLYSSRDEHDTFRVGIALSEVLI